MKSLYFLLKWDLFVFQQTYQEPKRKSKESGSKRKEIESDEDSPPRKAPAHRRMAIVYDSDEE